MVDEPELAGVHTTALGAAAARGLHLPGHPLPPDVTGKREPFMQAMRRLHELGATLVAGTDAGITPARPHGVLPYAFGDLIKAGMSPIEALRSLTAVAAEGCGVAGRKGRLAAGFDADIITVAGDPLVDADAVAKVSSVWRAGERVT
jgi:imidazolonepropionase-like amidohydrolase